MGDQPTHPPPGTKPANQWPPAWDAWLATLSHLSNRAAAHEMGLTLNEVAGRRKRLSLPPRVPGPPVSRTWDESSWSDRRLTEPWAKYTARRQAERNAKRNAQ